MNILHITTIFPKISETFILDLIIRLQKMGLSSYLLSRYRQSNLQPSTQDSTIHQDVNLVENVYYYSEILTKNKEKFRIKSNYRQLMGMIDCIVAHFADIPTEIAFKLSRQLGKPFIFFAHAREIFSEPNIENLNLFSNAASQIIVPTKYNQNYLTNLLGPNIESKIKIIRYGIDTEKFVRKNTYPNDGQKVICSIGRFVEKKGFEYTIRSFYKVWRKHPELRLKLIGEGPEERKIRSLVKELNLGSVTEIIAYQDHEKIVNELEKSHIFILPSVTAINGDREGVPVSILEAMAMELPVISTYHTGIPEAVKHGVTGFLCEERNENEISKYLEAIIVEPKLITEMGKLGRRQIINWYNQSKETAKLKTLLETIVEGK